MYKVAKISNNFLFVKFSAHFFWPRNITCTDALRLTSKLYKLSLKETTFILYLDVEKWNPSAPYYHLIKKKCSHVSNSLFSSFLDFDMMFHSFSYTPLNYQIALWLPERMLAKYNSKFFIKTERHNCFQSRNPT